MSKDNFYIFEMLTSYFEARHFQTIPTDIDNVAMFATYQKSSLYLVNLISLEDNYIFDSERYHKYRDTTRAQFADVRADKVILLNVMIMEHPDKVYDQVNQTPDIESDFVDVHWIVDSSNRELIIPDRQLKSVMGLERPIEELVTNGMEEYFELIKLRRPSHISLILILINIAVWILLEVSGGSTDTGTLLRFGAINVPLILATGQYWRLLSSVFLHIGFMHLAYNVFALYIFGSRLEKYINLGQYLGVYLFAGLAGSLMSFTGSLIMDSNVVAAGASGAIYGLLGAILVLTKASGQTIEGLSAYTMWVIFIAGIVYSVISPSVDAFAHIGGFIGGMIASAPIVLVGKRQVRGNEETK